jgi:acetyltransferase
MSLRSRFGASQLTEYESKQLLREHDIPTVNEDLANSPDEAEEIAREIGAPVVLKVDSRSIQHKTEAGGVKIVDEIDDVAAAYTTIEDTIRENHLEADINGILVEERLDGNEFIAGINHDPQFGKVLMFGLGGIYVEVFRDVSFRVIPLTEYDLTTMIEELQSRPLLKGARGVPPTDMDRLKDVLRKIAGLVQDEEEIHELDINPLFIKGNTITAADALVRLGDSQ